jgi:hypothetical protein
MTLTEDQMRKLTRILGMMGSDHDGEVLSAARAAQRFLGSLGATTWEEVLLQNNSGGARRWTNEDIEAAINVAYKKGYAAGEADGKEGEVQSFADVDSCPAFAKLCLAKYRHKLTEWEIGFCESWAEKSRYDEPSDKQRAIFQRLARKVGMAPP